MKALFALSLLTASVSYGQLSYPPNADTQGTTAIHKDSNVFTGWATGINVVRGYVQISDPTISHNGSNFASYGIPEDALGAPDNGVVSLGDAGTAVLTFATAITNGDGFDFAVFENGSNTFLELAFVEVSSNGTDFFRFPSHSETQTQTAIGGFGELDARNLNNLAGKYRADYGTPFDISDLPDNALLNKNYITHIKLVDAIGTIEPAYAAYDSFGNMIQDPYPTPFYSGGFDLAGVGIIHSTALGVNTVAKNKFVVYPNPAKDILTIDTGDAMSATVVLYDMSGRIVLQKNITGIEAIDISSCKQGVYLADISSVSQKAIMRVVIN